MDFEETNFNEEYEAEDSLPEELVEDEGDEQDLEEAFDDEEDGEGEENQEEAEDAEDDSSDSEGPKEPGYVKGRIDKAVRKAVQETEARFTAQIEALEAQYAPIKERLLEMDAQELVRKGEVKNIEIARELVRARQGLPPQQPAEGQPRHPNGQFAPKGSDDEGPADDPVVSARIDMLKHQADQIRADGGPDVIAEFTNNPKIKNAVIEGEMDFYDVAKQMRSQKKRPPSPMRSPNGANSIGQTTIEGMSDAQFRKLDKMLDEGVRFTLKR